MKILCEKCHQNITVEVSQQIERSNVGYVTCPHCNEKQRRYISKGDLLIYITYMETIYFVLALITEYLFEVYQFSAITIIVPLIMIVLVLILTSKFRYRLYTKGFLKKEAIYNKQSEDSKDINKSIRLRFIIYFFLIIMFISGSRRLLYVILMLVGILSSFIEALITIRKEK